MAKKTQINPNGDSYFRWMTRSWLDKAFAYILTPAILLGLVLMNVVDLEWYDEDTAFAYVLCGMFGLFSMGITQYMPNRTKLFKFLVIPGIITLLMVLTTLIWNWKGFTEAFALYWVLVYWGGYYVLFDRGTPT